MNDDLSKFLPYLLYRAAEQTSREFQRHYKERYGMLRTEWRVLFHIGQLGEMTAKEICLAAGLHKTKVSRAVRALEKKRMLARKTIEADRRSEALTLTKAGQSALSDLSSIAHDFDASFEAQLGSKDLETLRRILQRLIIEPR